MFCPISATTSLYSNFIQTSWPTEEQSQRSSNPTHTTMRITSTEIIGYVLIFASLSPAMCFAPRSGLNNLDSKVQSRNKFTSTTTPFKITTSVERTHEDRSKLNVHHGIPKLFRWLVDLYPIVLESVGEGLSGSNAMAVDNFYLDMNGIIHTCTHSNNDKLVLLNEREMFQRIFSYTDRLYKLVKPSRLMYLAVDGVAPRVSLPLNHGNMI